MTPRDKTLEIQRDADRICSLIVATDYPAIDIELMKSALREKVEEFFPDGLGLFDMIYESRFRRLAEQFRSEQE
jgi:predicted house-cleaning noncanonical NTP pyrophosphatase (MazG superfamily)